MQLVEAQEKMDRVIMIFPIPILLLALGSCESNSLFTVSGVTTRTVIVAASGGGREGATLWDKYVAT